MNEPWIVPANPDIYDHAGSFAQNGYIYWEQGRFKYQMGDTVYILHTTPVNRVMHKCIVTGVSIPSTPAIRKIENDFWHQKDKMPPKDATYVRFSLVASADTDLLDHSKLSIFGLPEIVQSPAHISNDMTEYIEEWFSRFGTYVEGYQAPAMKQMPAENEPLPTSVNEGVRVRHTDCGTGTITKVNTEKMLASVSFDDPQIGVRHFCAKAFNDSTLTVI